MSPKRIMSALAQRLSLLARHMRSRAYTKVPSATFFRSHSHSKPGTSTRIILVFSQSVILRYLPFPLQPYLDILYTHRIRGGEADDSLKLDLLRFMLISFENDELGVWTALEVLVHIAGRVHWLQEAGLVVQDLYMRLDARCMDHGERGSVADNGRGRGTWSGYRIGWYVS